MSSWFFCWWNRDRWITDVVKYPGNIKLAGWLYFLSVQLNNWLSNPVRPLVVFILESASADKWRCGRGRVPAGQWWQTSAQGIGPSERRMDHCREGPVGLRRTTGCHAARGLKVVHDEVIGVGITEVVDTVEGCWRKYGPCSAEPVENRVDWSSEARWTETHESGSRSRVIMRWPRWRSVELWKAKSCVICGTPDKRYCVLSEIQISWHYIFW